METHVAETNGRSVVSLPSFSLPSSQLAVGASLGNSAVWIHTKRDGAVERVFLNEIAQSLVGTFCVRYGGRPQNSSAFFSGLFTEGHRTIELHPAYQRVQFRLARAIDISETTFLPLARSEPGNDDPIVHVIVEIVNNDDITHYGWVLGSALLRGFTAPDVRARYEKDAHAIVASNASRPEWARVFTLSEEPTAYGVDSDFGASYDPLYEGISDSAPATGDPIGRLQCNFSLAPGESRRICLTVALSAAGEEDALARLAKQSDPLRELERTIQALDEATRVAQVLTPDPLINQGAVWSKVNMRRVMTVYPTGCALTNDPGKYANVVIRDSAWFIMGNDHFLPSFSRRLLDNLSQRQYADGKLPEYFDAISGRVEDDGLNINDDTPLYILAVNHHFRATGDRDWLSKTYPAVARAARYIISQIDERGLVFCTANDPRGDVWGIAGWRNIVAGYTINGAVTEINAECVAALRAAAHLAENLGNRESDARDFGEASTRIRAAMDAHLINPRNGLYYLNIDVDGNAHTDVTGDEVFPVMMRACSEETAFRIISRLTASDFRTPAGLRTVSRFDPLFDAAEHSGLVGGVWPGLTWWYAFAAARYHPEFMVRALRSSFEHYEADPRRYNTVPGQFSEWFDGESLANRGMRLSPWEPPRFLWAAVEGVCGLVLTPGLPKINPLMPVDWGWVALRNTPYQGSPFSFFFAREGDGEVGVYVTREIDCTWRVEVYDLDVSDSVRAPTESAEVVALWKTGKMVILVGNTAGETIHAPVYVADTALLPERGSLRIYNSERRSWEQLAAGGPNDLRAISLAIEAQGFRLLEFSALDAGS